MSDSGFVHLFQIDFAETGGDGAGFAGAQCLAVNLDHRHDEGRGGGDYGFGFNKGTSGLFIFQPSLSGDYSIVKFKMYRY